MRAASSSARLAVGGSLKAELVAVSAVLRTEAMSKGVQGGGGRGSEVIGAVGCEISV